MAACNAWTYRGISSSVFRSLQQVGKKQGFTIPNAASGKFMITVVGMNVGFQYAWDMNAQTLLLQCDNKPMLLGCSTIKTFADKIISESGGRVS
ncbi:hypothetical protein HZF08_16325 [Paenibacillus sp. CGMCC 1.16610]|uniref:Uncharacterized protein n=2 Tax=Paenibacillus TaxID=44249 RepID=A0ABU3RJ00_9BACL|nr:MULTISPECIES: hypothetical protein [Paenibacillus]MBA2939880.1 hypothetical protein [Paenibacillus sp. CGMCC 1.16610]MDU0204009.1 hypothetical protein [Paenibacillus sp. PFR10]MEC0268226.1 hypothetical protein [Paenibacillus anseongense]MVQ39540.1 hypothetical protein [Paenibacillus anseongense]